MHVVGAIVFTSILVVGLLAQPVVPTFGLAGFRQAVAAIVGFLVASAIFGNPDNVGGQAGPFDPANLIFVIPVLLLGIVHPRRRELFKLGKVTPFLAVAAIVVVVPLVAYGIDQALIQRNSWPPRSDPHHNWHWGTMAQLAFATPLLVLLAAVERRGWKLPAWSAAAALIGIGAASIAFPHAASALNTVWAAPSVVAGLALVALTARADR